MLLFIFYFSFGTSNSTLYNSSRSFHDHDRIFSATFLMHRLFRRQSIGPPVRAWYRKAYVPYRPAFQHRSAFIWPNAMNDLFSYVMHFDPVLFFISKLMHSHSLNDVAGFLRGPFLHLLLHWGTRIKKTHEHITHHTNYP